MLASTHKRSHIAHSYTIDGVNVDAYAQRKHSNKKEKYVAVCLCSDLVPRTYMIASQRCSIYKYNMFFFCLVDVVVVAFIEYNKNHVWCHSFNNKNNHSNISHVQSYENFCLRRWWYWCWWWIFWLFLMHQHFLCCLFLRSIFIVVVECLMIFKTFDYLISKEKVKRWIILLCIGVARNPRYQRILQRDTFEV